MEDKVINTAIRFWEDSLPNRDVSVERDGGCAKITATKPYPAYFNMPKDQTPYGETIVHLCVKKNDLTMMYRQKTPEGPAMITRKMWEKTCRAFETFMQDQGALLERELDSTGEGQAYAEYRF